MTEARGDRARVKAQNTGVSFAESTGRSLALWSPTLLRFRRRLRNVCAKYPRIYFSLVGFSRRSSGLVTRSSALVVEGYPRSANSWTEAAFLLLLGDSASIGHHTHASAQVKRAVEWQIPTVVLYRCPDDAVISRLMQEPRSTDLFLAYSEYVSFYSEVFSYRARFLLVSFSQATNDLEGVVGALNQRFGTSFGVPEPRTHSPARIHALVDELTRERIGDLRASYSVHRSQRELKEREEYRRTLFADIEAPQLQLIRRAALSWFRRLENANTLQPRGIANT